MGDAMKDWRVDEERDPLAEYRRGPNGWGHDRVPYVELVYEPDRANMELVVTEEPDWDALARERQPSRWRAWLAHRLLDVVERLLGFRMCGECWGDLDEPGGHACPGQ